MSDSRLTIVGGPFDRLFINEPEFYGDPAKETAYWPEYKRVGSELRFTGFWAKNGHRKPDDGVWKPFAVKFREMNPEAS